MKSSANLQKLYHSDNNFQGIPEAIENLNTLKAVYMAGNRLNKSLLDLSKLQIADFYFYYLEELTNLKHTLLWLVIDSMNKHIEKAGIGF